MANVEHISAGGFGLVDAVKAFFANISESLRNSREFQRTYQELDALTSRELNDLGISRSDISRIAYDAVYGEKTEYHAR